MKTPKTGIVWRRAAACLFSVAVIAGALPADAASTCSQRLDFDEVYECQFRSQATNLVMDGSVLFEGLSANTFMATLELDVERPVLDRFRAARKAGGGVQYDRPGVPGVPAGRRAGLEIDLVASESGGIGVRLARRECEEEYGRRTDPSASTACMAPIAMDASSHAAYPAWQVG